MTYDERWNTCGVDRMDMWTQLMRDGFLFMRKEDDIADLLQPGAVVVTLIVKAPWGETRNLRIEGVEPPSKVIIDALVDASLRKEAAQDAQGAP